nr:MAG TPA: WYL domain protein [Bacteriophage sp.]
MNEEMSDLVALFVLGMCTFYSVWLSMEFSPRSKLHLLWTIPVGFFGCFVALAIFSLAVSPANDFLFIATVSALFLPFPIWRLYNRRKFAPVPKEQAAPKEPSAQISTPASLFDSVRNMKSKLDLQTALLKKNNGDDLPPPEVSGSKYINPNDPKLKQHYEPFKGWRSDFKKEMGRADDDFDDDEGFKYINRNDPDLKARYENFVAFKAWQKKRETSQRHDSYFDDDDFILNEDDEIEELPDGLSLGDEISFSYTNAHGEFSDRRFVIRRFDGLYLYGWDLDKQNTRTFRIDRIDGGVVKISTGEVFYF